ncbi:MAG: hypothetical protein IJP55_00135 [Bacteroidales bacterium]|nr:hypothetical protein [Bacteroidales bacterium]
MKRILIALLAVTLSAGVFAQSGKLPIIMDIANIETNYSGIETDLSVFSMERDGHKGYYFCVGNLGIGDNDIQILFDPVFKLFIHLGDTLSGAIETLTSLQELAKQPGGTMQLTGSFSATFPNDQTETVTVTSRKPLLTRLLEFSLEREGYVRATHVSKSDLGSLLSSCKFYSKIHPKEQ